MKKVLSIALLVGLMASCSVPKPLYSWYNYEDATYQYDKKQSEATQQHLLEVYQKNDCNANGIAQNCAPWT